MKVQWRSLALLVTSSRAANGFRSTSHTVRPCSPACCYHRTITTRVHAKSTEKSPSFQLRNATLLDLETILEWEEKPHLQDPDTMGDEEYNDWNWPYELARKDLPWRFQLIAECNQRPIGVIQIIDPALEESHYWGEDCPPNLRALDIWIGEEEYLGQGYGTEMMKQALRDYCFSDPTVEAALVDPMASNPKAHRFYQKFGFVPEGIRYFGPDKCLVHRLTREDYEKTLHRGDP